MYQLRELERGDLDKINQWRNDPDLIACLGAPYRYINEDVDREWYDKYLRTRGNSVRCTIVDKETDEVLGLISLMSIDSVNRSAQLHIMIGRAENRGKGVGTFAVRAMVAHAFNDLNLCRIELGVLEYNLPALRLYEKIGFVREGLKRQSNYKNGDYHDLIIMGLLRDEFRSAE